jgi:recombinational DNA repair protein RecT
MENQTTALATVQVSEMQLGKYLTAMGLVNKLNEKETTQFIQIAKAYNLNPFKREIYCVKYGDSLSIIVGYESYIKRAERSGLLNGYNVKTEGDIASSNLKAIVTIHRKDWANPFVHEVFFTEYVQNSPFWKNKP